MAKRGSDLTPRIFVQDFLVHPFMLCSFYSKMPCSILGQEVDDYSWFTEAWVPNKPNSWLVLGGS